MSAEAAETIFTRIIRGEIPCHKVFENEHLIAFLDINPLADGHTLVVPKEPAARLETLSPDSAAAVARALGPIARRVLAAVGAHDYNVLQNNGTTAGQEVMHVHFHIIPRRPGDGLGYRWNPKPASSEHLVAIAAKINQQT